MTNLIETPHSRRDFLKGGGALIVAFSTPLTLGTATAKAATGAIGPALVDPNLIDSWVAVGQDGRVTIFTGKVRARDGPPDDSDADRGRRARRADQHDRPRHVGHMANAGPGHDVRQPVDQDELRRRSSPGLRRGSAGPDRHGSEEARRTGEHARDEGRRRRQRDGLHEAGDLRRADRRTAVQPQVDGPCAAEEAVRAEGRRPVDRATSTSRRKCGASTSTSRT